MATIDLNADLGETIDGVPTADDEAMFSLISSANIACGGHAGDADSMRQAVERAVRFGVAVGAHPSYPDRAGFGRVVVSMSAVDLRLEVTRQLLALRAEGADIRYVKPHGALYHAAGRDSQQAAAVVAAVTDLSETLGRALPILALGEALRSAALAAGLPFVREAFLDRAYSPDGSLVPRSTSGAVLDAPAVVAERAVQLVRDRTVTAVDGTTIRVDAASFCVHGDTPAAIELARAVRRALSESAVDVASPW
ncbi:UPF0271 protein [Microbacterium endophyticum]|uniref:UPF0271 protein n=1 Tax=Microbacterium endophyticum TaxID=1526412 RepID=A0A7W4V3D7_9MICO|nr:5-oxoprolinase subunit PxpA [Microbacterium endophyticum]MBB2975408.1 UPF0271 protein [Microbacterium endophyticum]NIK35573.1 UPF0271 protein [Microbacterium endophyticum]